MCVDDAGGGGRSGIIRDEQATQEDSSQYNAYPEGEDEIFPRWSLYCIDVRPAIDKGKEGVPGECSEARRHPPRIKNI